MQEVASFDSLKKQLKLPWHHNLTCISHQRRVTRNYFICKWQWWLWCDTVAQYVDPIDECVANVVSRLWRISRSGAFRWTSSLPSPSAQMSSWLSSLLKVIIMIIINTMARSHHHHHCWMWRRNTWADTFIHVYQISQLYRNINEQCYIVHKVYHIMQYSSWFLRFLTKFWHSKKIFLCSDITAFPTGQYSLQYEVVTFEELLLHQKLICCKHALFTNTFSMMHISLGVNIKI